MTPLDRLSTGLLDLLRPIITPDWGALVSLIPLGLLLVVLAYVGLMGRRWRLRPWARRLPRHGRLTRTSTHRLPPTDHG